MSEIRTTVVTEATHTVTLHAPEGEPFVIETFGSKIAATRIDFKVYTDGRGTLRRLGVGWVANGFAVKTDGTVGKAKRMLQGGNPIALPLIVRLAAAEALREEVGVLNDPDKQIEDWTGRLPGRQS